ncbi:MAG: hypothetical protein IKJ45_00740, partial [Kiritimatiellae bacterium]|nr:hypothetical protein [Kiritimatiellia bacterium]
MRMRNVMLSVVLLASMNLSARMYDRCPQSVFTKVKDSIVILTGDNGSGTGFIVEMDGAKWL